MFSGKKWSKNKFHYFSLLKILNKNRVLEPNKASTENYSNKSNKKVSLENSKQNMKMKIKIKTKQKHIFSPSYVC